MESLTKTIETNIGGVVLAIGLILGVLLFVTFRTLSESRRVRARWGELIHDTSGRDLERILHDHLKSRLELEEQLRDAERQISILQEKMASSKRFVGLVRYDAFEDVGGAQSFALAVYDERGNGAVINSLVGRTDCRVYCKPLVGGRSDRNLSQEEMRAVNDAQDLSHKPLLTNS